jgi:hypothetical protein
MPPIFPILALGLGVLVSGYLFIDWIRHGRRSRVFLYWALALFLIYWFQVPVILTSLGRTVTVPDFNVFFALALPITFLALVLIYWGVLDALRIRLTPRAKALFGLWFLSALIFFGYHFIVRGGIIETYALPLAGNVVFYLPIRLLIIATLARWLLRRTSSALYGILGASGVIGESVLGLVRNFLIVKNVLIYPPQLWYLVLSSLEIFFILQTAGIILLVMGFFFFHRMHYKTLL